jgi:hypothetical protein
MRRRLVAVERKEEESIEKSKVTTQSILSNASNSMNSSFMRQESLKKQQRNSNPKMPLQEIDDIKNNENYQYLRKMSDYPRPTHKLRDGKPSSKIDNMNWKLF